MYCNLKIFKIAKKIKQISKSIINYFLKNRIILIHFLYFLTHKKSKFVIYTCISGNYDDLLLLNCISNKFDYICYTDNLRLLKKKKWGAWRICPLQLKSSSPQLTNRAHKILPHKFLSEYTHSIYLDGNIDITSKNFYKLFLEIIRKDSAICLLERPERRCCYAEAEACIALCKDAKNKIIETITFLKKKGFPLDFGLTANRIILRQHTSPTVVATMEAWWGMLCKFSRRDQLSLMFVLWEKGQNFDKISYDKVAPYIKIHRHTTDVSSFDYQYSDASMRYGNNYQSMKQAIEDSLNNPMLNFIRDIKEGASVLEFGSSWGYYTRYIKEEKRGEITICEYSAEAIKKAQQYADMAICGDIEANHWHESLGNSKYDYILFFDVLEHLKDPITTLNNAAEHLNSNGTVAISIPNIAYNGIIKMLLKNTFTYQQLGILDYTHLRFFAYNNLNLFTSNNSLEIESITPIYRNEKSSYINCELPGLLKIFSPLLFFRPGAHTFQFFLTLKHAKNFIPQ